MRVLHILDHSIPLHSGYSFRTLAILNEQRKLGYATFHLTGAKHATQALKQTVDGWEFFRTPNAKFQSVPVLNQVAGMHALRRRLSDVVASVKPDILHAHSPVLNALPTLKIGAQFKIPVVYEVRAFWEDAAVDHGSSRENGLRYGLTRGLETYALRHANAVTTICEGLRNDIVNRGIPPAKVTVIPNAVDITKFSVGAADNIALKQSLGLSGCTVLGFIGSFYAYEGLHLIIDVLPLLLKDAPNVRVLLVGGGPQDEALKQRAAELNVADKVIFTGRVAHEEVARYYDAIDVLIYPRLSMRLTELVTPLKPLEAMAQGRLLVASDVGGHRELIRDNETGILFKAGDLADLQQKILALLKGAPRWPALRQAARQFVESERTWTASVARYRAIYESLL